MEQKGGAKPSGFMGTVIGGKTLTQYMGIIKMPLLALIGLDIVSFLTGFLGYIPAIGFAFAMLNVLVSLVIFVLTLGIAGYIGYSAVKKYGGDLLSSLVAGALAGLISGVVSGVLNLVSAMAMLGMGRGLGSVMVMGASMVGLIISPIFGAILGGILAVIGGAVAGARTFGPASAGQTVAKK
jgi:hypothetical protein